MNYDKFTYLWPPRPRNAIPPSMIRTYEEMGFVAQLKKNGTCSIIAVSPTGEITAMNRHNETHKLWTPTPASSAAFKNLPGSGWYVFVAKLMHSKVTDGPRDTNYIFDLLVQDGEYLVGQTMMQRQERLARIFPTYVGETTSHFVINDNTWLVKTYLKGFKALYDGLKDTQDEGIVLKKPGAKLELCSKETSNSASMVKARKVHKNFSF